MVTKDILVGDSSRDRQSWAPEGGSWVVGGSRSPSPEPTLPPTLSDGQITQSPSPPCQQNPLIRGELVISSGHDLRLVQANQGIGCGLAQGSHVNLVGPSLGRGRPGEEEKEPGPLMALFPPSQRWCHPPPDLVFQKCIGFLLLP